MVLNFSQLPMNRSLRYPSREGGTICKYFPRAIAFLVAQEFLGMITLILLRPNLDVSCTGYSVNILTRQYFKNALKHY